MIERTIQSLSLSELSFIIFSDKFDKDLQRDAFEELKRRFSNSTFSLEAFLEYEKDTIKKRGNCIDDYLISQNASITLLLNLYFSSVYKKEIFQHGNLLFSENLLCHSDGENTFFVKALRYELKRLENTKSPYLSKEETDLLNSVIKALKERINKKQPIWYESSLTECTWDIMNDSLITLFPVISYLSVYNFLLRDLAKLSLQKKAIMNSMKNATVDYSIFYNEEIKRTLIK